MSPKTVRAGGIAALALVVAVSLMQGIAVAGGSTPAFIEFALDWASLAILAVYLFVYWTTKGLFNALAYTKANRSIFVVMILTAIVSLIDLFGPFSFRPLAGIDALGEAVDKLTVLISVLLIFQLLAWMWFSIRAIDFGRHSDSLLWQVVGIADIVGSALIVLALAAHSPANRMLPIFFALSGLVVLLSGWICHGIALIIGARSMSQARSPAPATHQLGGSDDSG